MAAERCFREIQSPGQLFGVSPIEVIILLAIPLLLAPIFTIMELNLIFIFVIDIMLYALLRYGNRLSGFDHGVTSTIYYYFVWPRQLSGYEFDEHDYLTKRHQDKEQTTP